VQLTNQFLALGSVQDVEARTHLLHTEANRPSELLASTFVTLQLHATVRGGEELAVRKDIGS
jgi:hypothetical protein